MYKSVFEESKKQPLKEVTFSVTTIDDALETIQYCVSLLIVKKSSNLVMILNKIVHAVVNGVKDALQKLNKTDKLSMIIKKMIYIFKSKDIDTMESPEEEM